LRKYHYLQLHG